jgi:hypothetical protein
MRPRRPNRLALALAVASLVALAIPLTTALQPSGATPPPAWSVQADYPPNTGSLYGVSCGTAQTCVAVSYDDPAIDLTSDGGTTWSGSLGPAGDQFQGVSCPGPNDCFAAGLMQTDSGLVGVIAATTDGGVTWTSQSLPSGVAALSGISCPSSTTCIAVGESIGSTPVLLGTVNGGGTWSTQSIPTGIIDLTDASCSSVSDCVAVGDAAIIATTNGGMSWVAEIPPTGSQALESVSCALTTIFCVAVGFLTNGTQPGVIDVSTNNGASWTSEPLPPAAAGTVVGVSCPTATTCFAVGYNVPNQQHTFIGTINGGVSWFVQTTPGDPQYLTSISCSSASHCVGVGQAAENSGPTLNGGFITTTSNGGGTWTIVPTPSGVGVLKGEACPSTSVCYSAGGVVEQGGALTETVNAGASWTVVSLPSYVEALDGISCPSPLDCVAVGADVVNQNPLVIETTDGGNSWSDQELISDNIITLAGVSCPTSLDCVVATEFPAGIETTTDGGSTWVSQTIPTGENELEDVSCASTTFCVATGVTNSGAQSLTSTDGGIDWAVMAMPAGVTNLEGVSCAAAAICTAVGYGGTAATGVAVGTVNAGLTWTAETLPQGVPFLTGVSCSTTIDCVAVGTGTGPVTGIETTNGGTSWSIIILPSGAATLAAVSCPYSTECVADGSNPDDGGVILGNLPPNPPIISGTLQPGILSTSYSQQLAVGGGDAPYTWSLATGALPAGLTLNPTSGLVFGIPTTVGTRNFTVAAVDSAGAVGAESMSLTVKATTNTVVSATPSPSSYGQTVSFNAQVSSAAGVPDGTVTFTIGSSTLCTTPDLLAGSASCSAASAATGSDTLTATYSGDATHLGSVAMIPFTVAKGSSTTSLSASPNPVYASEFVTYTAGVAAASPSTGVPSGSVSFNDAGSAMAGCSNVALSGSPPVATCTESYQAAGTQSPIVATYSGNSNFNGSQSTSLSEGVQMANSATVATVSPRSQSKGSVVIYSATVSGNVGSPTGTVAFSLGSRSVCSAMLSGGAASCASSAASVGANQTVTASYLGSTIYNPSSGVTTLSVTPSHGYWLVGADGGIFTFGGARFHGSTGNISLNRPVVGITPTADDGGYWLVASDGGVFSFGDANFVGSMPGLGFVPAGAAGGEHLNAPIVGIVPSQSGTGYFMVASDGGVFAFNAPFAGSCPGLAGGCSGAAVGVVPDHSGNGYWLVTATGHVYAFGDAQNFGAPGQQSSSITSIVRTPDGNGYWILDANGGVFAYGDATGYGSLPAGAAGGFDPAYAIFTTSDGAGYWVVTALGKVYDFGDAPSDGDMSATHLNAAIIAATGF